MTSYRQARSQQAPSSLWLALVLLGVAVTVFGLLLITRPFDTAKTLAVLAGVALVLSGISEAVAGAKSPESNRGVMFGLLLIAGGVVILVWPGITLWAVAVVVGICLVVAGLMRLAVGLQARDRGDRWVAMLVFAAVSIVVGAMALIWPSATIAVLAVLFGIQLIIQGVGEIVLGFALRPAH
nr:DUF308 domain-containing protein [Micromonospora sp. DSM 115978]